MTGMDLTTIAHSARNAQAAYATMAVAAAVVVVVVAARSAHTAVGIRRWCGASEARAEHLHGCEDRGSHPPTGGASGERPGAMIGAAAAGQARRLVA